MRAQTIPVSVVTTCKGRLHHLKQSLPSMLAQECQFDYETIVVDYGCPDGTAAWCLEQQDPRLKVARVLNGTEFFSPSRARNCGAWVAEGSVLAFVDADIILSPNWLMEVCHPLLGGDVSLCHVEPGKGDWDRNGTCAVTSQAFHQVRGYDEAFQGWGNEVGDFYDRVKQEAEAFCWYARNLVEPIHHGNRERTQYFQEKSITMSARLNDARVARRLGPVNPSGFGVAEVEGASAQVPSYRIQTGLPAPRVQEYLAVPIAKS